MILVVGLGNIGKEYEDTRHNVGFMLIDLLLKEGNFTNLTNSKFKGELFKMGSSLLLKPHTYMNNSGDSVYELKKYFKVPLSDILIVLDDIDLPKGKIRFRLSGSAGTHNGLRDIVSKVGSTPRLKIGISRDESMSLADYVLSSIDSKSKELLSASYVTATDLIEKFINGELCQDLTICNN